MTLSLVNRTSPYRDPLAAFATGQVVGTVTGLILKDSLSGSLRMGTLFGLILLHGALSKEKNPPTPLRAIKVTLEVACMATIITAVGVVTYILMAKDRGIHYSGY